MAPRFLVIGARGQLGRDLCPRLPGEVISVGRDSADLTQPELLRTALDQHRPDTVINCAAYNLVDRAESEPDIAFAANAFGVRSLAKLCHERAMTLVHFSSDYVFGSDPSRKTPWLETDVPGPVSVYGTSKLAGEYFVQAENPRHVIIRTCGLYGVWGSGGKGTNFIETMLRVTGQGKPLRVVQDQRCTPTYTVDLAECVVRLLATGSTGLFHITNAGECSWHELAAAIFAETGVKAQLSAIQSAEFGAAARRPTYSVLSDAKIRSIGIPALRPWRDALRAYLAERNTRTPTPPSS